MRHLTLTAAALTLGAAPALAEYPEKDLQGIIQWGAGGSTDTVMRALIRTPADQFGAMRAGHQRKPAWPLTRSRSALRATH